MTEHGTTQGGASEAGAGDGRRPNRLIHETSPYLLQHAYNPVAWWPWSPEALAEARRLDRPILLSVGYSACHWCHVMEHESFEDPATAQIMNEHFVNIKVDREERPDIDSIYMEAVQAMTGHGGWPMTVFLTPDGRPFYGGTYFPKADRLGMPSFKRVLLAVAEAYRTKREEIERSADELTEALGQRVIPAGEAGALGDATLEAAREALWRSFDRRFGGFGNAPKFPQPMNLEFLLRYHARFGDARALEMVELTLEKMAHGGIYDQLGGGFHRYSVDAVWLVPHFEKMLYDNAQLATAYLHAWQVTRRPLYRRIVEETLTYVMREMTDPAGGFYSTQDADSEGEEGKFFLWTPEQVIAALGPEDGRLFNLYYDVTRQGNFEGRNILNVRHSPEHVAREAEVSVERLEEALTRGRALLFELREQRVKPDRDEKVLTAWNGLMLRAFAEAARVFGRDDFRAVAERNADFVLGHLLVDGRLRRSWKDGQARFDAYLEDYAGYADGLLALYETTFDTRWFTAARALADTMIAEFADESGTGFWDTARGHEALVTRPKDLFDNATPAGNSVAAEVLLRLARYTGEPAYEERAAAYLNALAPAMAQAPTGFGRLLCAADFYLAGAREVAIIGDPAAEDTRTLLQTAFVPFRPEQVVALARPGDAEAARAVPLLADRPQIDGRATAYICRHFACERPTTDPETFASQLDLP